MSATLRKMGILGGMGPEATLELQRRVQAATGAQDDQDHIPMCIDMNPQVPSRIAHLIEKTGPDPGPVLGRMAQGLQSAGAEALAMPCNTAHLYAADIIRDVDIELLNMPQLACTQVAEGLERGAHVGILASPATQDTQLFGDFLAPFGITALYPAEDAALLASIRRIKQIGPSQPDIALLEATAAALAAQGAERIIVGCSEFSLISHDIHAPVPIIDTLDVLVEEIVTFCTGQSSSAA